MRSPFPGMDPYLEQHWGDVHHNLISFAEGWLNERLPRDLQVQLCDWLANAEADIQDQMLVTQAEMAGPRLITGCMADPNAELAARGLTV